MKLIFAFLILQATLCFLRTPKARRLSLTLSSPVGKTPARKLAIFTDDAKSKQIIVLKKDLVDMEAEIAQNASYFNRRSLSNTEPAKYHHSHVPKNR